MILTIVYLFSSFRCHVGRNKYRIFMGHHWAKNFGEGSRVGTTCDT